MRCKTCDYPLWQIRDRKCPECGTGFRPSDFEFTLNSVRFCCPHCDQAYYGTGERGHLVPRMFPCVGCAKTIDMDEMVLLPTAGVREEQTQVTVVPWVERRERGWFTSFFVTMGMAIANPRRTIEAVPEGSSARRAFWYMAIHVALQIMLSGMPLVVGVLLLVSTVARGSGAPIGFFIGFPICAVGAPLLVVLGALLVHGVLRMTGSTAAGFGRTMHAICYSSGNNFLMAVPCLGAYFLWIPGVLWWTITAGFMLASAQKVRGWRAALAVAAPALVVFLSVVGVVAMLLFGVQSVSTAMASMPGMTSQFTRIAPAADKMAQILDGTSGTGMANGKQRPKHPAELLMNFTGTPSDFILPGSASDSLRARVQDLSLNNYQFSFGSGQGDVRGKLATDPSAGTSACRVGDYVFTYGDLPQTGAADELWLAIGWPDPDMNPNDPAEVAIVRSGGDAEIVKLADFDAALTKQNEIRAKDGLAAIPHPRVVHATNDTPPPPASAARTTVRGWPAMPSDTGAIENTRITSIVRAMLDEPTPVRHIGELLAGDRIQPEELFNDDGSNGAGAGNGDRMGKVRIGHRTLSQLQSDPEKIKKYASDKAIADLPPNAVAYRVGDTVFTHVGMKLDDPKVRQSQLWIVVGCSESPGSGAMIAVGRANGMVRSFRARELAGEVAAQNRLRKIFGLAPIPLPTQIKQNSAALPAPDESGGTKPDATPDAP